MFFFGFFFFFFFFCFFFFLLLFYTCMYKMEAYIVCISKVAETRFVDCLVLQKTDKKMQFILFCRERQFLMTSHTSFRRRH